MRLIATLFLLCGALTLTGQTIRVSDQHNLPLAQVEIWQLPNTFWCLTDENGHPAKPLSAQHSYRLFAPGFEVTIVHGPSFPSLITLQPISGWLNEVVTTASRTERSKRELPLQVTTLSPKRMEQSNAPTLAEGLNLQPGLRVEVDCQTCNYTQIRMNGLPGPNTQILINGMTIFGAMSGLYGLEQIPASSVKTVEVVRGAGSVVYGPGAIGGTVNILLQKPENQSFEISSDLTALGMQSPDVSTRVASSIYKTEHAAVSATGTLRSRMAFDANNDGFSEISQINQQGLTLQGAFGTGPSTWNAHAAYLREVRDGGDQLNLDPDQRQQSEWRESNLLLATLENTLQTNLGEWQSYAGASATLREHYTGFGGPDGFGNTENFLLNAGTRLSGMVQAKGLHRWVAGLDFQAENLYDAVPGYGYAVNQQTRQLGIYAQDEWRISGGHALQAGVRFNLHNALSTPLLTPRIAWKWDLAPLWSTRLSWGLGFRPPQLFDTDLHISFAGGGVSRVFLDPNLRPEKAQTVSAELEFRPSTSSTLSITGFYTRQTDPFILAEGAADSLGNQVLIRSNGLGATVAGATLQGALAHERWSMEGAFTLQMAAYDEAVQWSATATPEIDFLRTPQAYGYLTLARTWNRWTLSGTATLTGPMKVPHFGGAPGVPEDELTISPWFVDLGLRASRGFSIGKMNAEAWLGVINLLNAFQTDFDQGPNRDSNYIYGPSRPRSVTAGFRLSLGKN